MEMTNLMLVFENVVLVTIMELIQVLWRTFE